MRSRSDCKNKVGMEEIQSVERYCLEKEFSLRMKGKVYKSYVRSAMLYGSKTWHLRENEVAILRAEKSMVRAMCGVKLVDKRNTVELMDMLGLKKAEDKLARADGVRWYGHVLRRAEDVLINT